MVLGVQQDSQSRRRKQGVRRLIAAIMVFGVVAGGVAFPMSPSDASPMALDSRYDPVVGLKAQVSDGTVDLTWAQPETNGFSINYYEIEYSIDNGVTWSPRQETGPDVDPKDRPLIRSLRVEGLANGTEYLFQVRVVADGRVGPWAQITATPTKPPPAPTAVTAVAGQKKVTVSWTAPVLEPGIGIDHYEVEVKTTSGAAWRTALTDLDPNENKTTTTNTSVDVEQFLGLDRNRQTLRLGTEYEFRVVAVNPAGAGEASQSATATPFDVPDSVGMDPSDGFVVTQTGDTAFTLSWMPPQDNGKPILRYDVEFAEDAGTPAWQAATGSCGTGTLLTRTCELTGLTPVTAYLFRIRAVNDAGDAEWGETWQGEIVVGPAFAPHDLAGVSSNTTVMLSWFEPQRPQGHQGPDPQWGGVFPNQVCDSFRQVVYEVQTFAGGTWGSVETRPVDCYELPQMDFRTQPPTVVVDQTTGQPVGSDTFIPSDGASPGPQITFAVRDLTNGVSYDFRVRVMVNGRAGEWAELKGVVPSTLPSQVSSVTAVRGDTQVELSWDAPHDGGSPITGYYIEKHDGSGWTDAEANTQSADTNFTVTGLTNGTAYTFRITALNANGAATDSSSPSNVVTPVSLPGAPTGLSATRGNKEVSLTWTVVDSQVTGEELVGHRIQQSTDNGASWSDAIADTASVLGGATVTGLTNGTAYLFRVAGISAAGSGQYVTLASGITPSTTPDAPASVTAVAGDGEVTLSWDAPHDGGSVITGYRIEKDDGDGWTVAEANTGNAQTTFTVTNLTNGTSYDFRVVPINQNGASLTASPGLVSRVTPVAPPGVPAQPVVVAGPGSVTVTVTKGSGGDPATFTVTSDPEARTCTVAGAGGSCTVTGLTPGTAYTFTAVAQNGAGTSQASVVSDAATPLALPTPPPPPPPVTVPPSSGGQNSQGNDSQAANPGNGGSSGDAAPGPSGPGASDTPVNGVRPSPASPTPTPVSAGAGGTSDSGVPPINGVLNGASNGVNGAGRVGVLAAPASPVPTVLSAAQLDALTQRPGGVTVTVNGVTQTATVLRFDGVVSANGATPSPETTAQLLAYGNTIISALRDVTPNVDDMSVRVEEKDGRVFLFGAAVQPSDPGTSLGVPVEHVVTVLTGDTAVLVAGVNADDEPAPLSPSGALRINRDGYVAVSAFGLPAGAEGEVVVMSTPQSLGQFTVGADGGFSGQVQLPDGLIGEHTVVLAAGSVANAVGIEILDDTDDIDVVTDATGDDREDGTSNMLLRVLTLLAGLFLVWLLVKRRTVKREPVATRH